MSREVAKGMSKWRYSIETDDLALAVKAQQQHKLGLFKAWRRRMRKRDLATRALQHALHSDLSRAWTTWNARERVSPLVLAQRAAAFFMAHGTVGAFHAWVARKREADAVLERTFASAASILPIAGGVAPTGGVAPVSPSPTTPPQKKAQPPARPPSRPRMVFH